jgi:hypothetical protein
MDGEANQKDITGASGTPPMSNEAITGITPHEQKGLNAPTMVANIIAIIGLFLKALLMYLDAPDNRMATAIGMVINRYGQICQRLVRMRFVIFSI